MATIFTFIKWVFEKFAMGILIVVLGLVAGAIWFFLKDNTDFEVWQREVVRSVSAERIKVQSAIDDVRHRLDRLTEEIAAEKEKGRQADKVTAQLRELESTWDKVFGDRAQQQANAQRLIEVAKIREAATARVTSTQNEFKRTTWERDGLEIALARLDARLHEAKVTQSKAMHYLELSWGKLKWWVIATLTIYFCGPTLGKMGLFFWFAPWVTTGRPVRLRQDLDLFPEVGPSAEAAEITLRPGERLWVRGKYLRSSEAGLERRSRRLLNWWMPFSCLASGLVGLVEMKWWKETGGNRVRLSSEGSPHSELAIVTLGEGAALVLRPRFLVGVILADGQRVRIRGRWPFLRWHAWVTQQFRFFEFTGPCRLIVAGTRGVRAEHLIEGKDNVRPARRWCPDAMIGFTPNLEYSPVRAETFWSYYRGKNPLFDDLFAGRGFFLSEPAAVAGALQPPRKFWATAWGSTLKLFGL